MEDVRALLNRSLTVPQTTREKTAFSVIHWNGPSVMHAGLYPGDMATLKIDADWHVDHNGWDGLAYHFAIGRHGQTYKCRDWSAKLPHSGNSLMNAEAFSVLVITGEGDGISVAQYSGLLDVLRMTNRGRRFWLGHQEAPRSTACPGALLMRWLRARRAEVRLPVSGVLTRYAANVRDEASVLSQLLGVKSPGEYLAGHWVLGQPVKGDALWLELPGDRFVHASALDTRSYAYVG